MIDSRVATRSVAAAVPRRRLFLGAVVGAVLVVVALASARPADAAPTCSTWQGWQYCGESELYGPPGALAVTYKVQQYGYTYPCQYVSYKVGTQWYPQSEICAGPYSYWIDQGSGTAICIYAEHWIRDGVSASPRLTTYHC